jgi:hypothetical protein
MGYLREALDIPLTLNIKRAEVCERFAEKVRQTHNISVADV